MQFDISEDITFEQAIAFTQSLLDDLSAGTIPPLEVEQAIETLVKSESGARGFFVTYLSDPRPLADQPTVAVRQALGKAPAVVSPLLIKNLAMSTAMAITHRRNQNEELAQGSDRVRSRTLHLIQALPLPELRDHARQLMTSINTHTGSYQPFLDRWGYDTDQQQAIRQTLEQIPLN